MTRYNLTIWSACHESGSKQYTIIKIFTPEDREAFLIKNWGRVGSVGQFKVLRAKYVTVANEFSSVTSTKLARGYNKRVNKSVETVDRLGVINSVERMSFSRDAGKMAMLTRFLDDTASETASVAARPAESTRPAEPKVDPYADDPHWGSW